MAGKIARCGRFSKNAGPGRSAGGKRSGNPQGDGLCVKKARGRKKLRQESSALSRAISACLMPHQVRAASFTGRVSWATEMHESALALAEPEGSVQGFSHICGGVGQACPPPVFSCR